MDVDIDLEPDFDPTKFFHNVIPASKVENDQLKKHPVWFAYSNGRTAFC